MLGATVNGGVLRKVVDKTAKNDSTGKYDPTGETREINEIDKFFRSRDAMTTAEIRAGEPAATFHATWLAANKGILQNRAKGVAKVPGKLAGMPPPAAKPAVTPTSMFN